MFSRGGDEEVTARARGTRKGKRATGGEEKALDGDLAELHAIAPDDEIVFETIRQRLADFDAFKREILAFLRDLPGATA